MFRFNEKLKEAPLGYWEEKSYMMVIPSKIEDDFLRKSIKRLEHNKEIVINKTNFDISGTIDLNITYEDEDYDVGIYLGNLSVPEYYLSRNMFFTEEEKSEILAAQKSITVFMEFKKDVKKCYHLQLKLASILVPDLIGILDESAEKMLPKKWVNLTAKSKVLPSSKDLFSVQAVRGDDGEVWLHTHGLCRLGITELEILESDSEHFGQHYNLLNTYAMYLVDKKDKIDPIRDSVYIGRLADNTPVVVTCRSWVDGLKEYKRLKLGNVKDRKDGHNSKTSIIFLYTSEANEEKRILSKVSVYDKLWGDNPLFFFSDEETIRMGDLARERFSYVKKSFKEKKYEILIKVAVPTSVENEFEHIWFELIEIKGNKFKGRLTQEPYDIPNMHTDDEAWYGLDDITDWIIYADDKTITPGSAYLLNE